MPKLRVSVFINLEIESNLNVGLVKLPKNIHYILRSGHHFNEFFVNITRQGPQLVFSI